jgi:peptide/nickel transport system permease protein
MATQSWAEEGLLGLEPEAGAPPPSGRLSDILYQFRGNPATIAGAVILGLVLLAAIIVPEFPPYPPYAVDINNAAIGPTWAHPFGTDQYGHDVFTRVLIAARLDLIIAISAVAFSLTIGVAIGAAAGFLGRWVDESLMRTQDVLQAFPRFVFAMAVAFAMGPGVFTVIVATAAINVPGYARLMRNLMLTAKESEYALAAVAVGNTRLRLLWRHLLPNTLVPIIVVSTLQCGWAILEAAGLSFIGLGVRVPRAEWGVMISMGLQDFLNGHWWIYTFPGLAIAFTVLGFNLLGDGLQDILDPRRRRA